MMCSFRLKSLALSTPMDVVQRPRYAALCPRRRYGYVLTENLAWYWL